MFLFYKSVALCNTLFYHKTPGMTKFTLIIMMIAVVPLFVNCTSDNSTEITVTSNAFKSNKLIPDKYTCDGENVSPQLSWTKGPEKTKTYVLICDDPDAPSKVWVHWLIFNIPATTNEIDENADNIPGAKYGTTDFRNTKYGGPCPPNGTHHYHFRIYALDSELALEAGATRAKIENAMKDHILAKGELIGLYSRKK